jgi:adenylate cyclase
MGPARLIVLTPDGQRLEYPLRAINTIGRHPDQNIQILDRVVSKEHALVTGSEKGYFLQDMGSRNGTYVNGVQITGRTPLNDGDTITMGSSRLIFEDQRRPATPALDRVTIHPGTFTESAIRSMLPARTDAQRDFLSEDLLKDDAQLRRDYEKLRIAFELNQAVGDALEIEALLDRILDKAFEFTHADRGVILLMTPDGRPVPRATKTREGQDAHVDISQTILSEVIDNHHAVLSSDATMDSRFGGSHSIIMQGIRSTVCVPLLFRGELVGMMHLDSRIATGIFTEKDLQILTVFAQQAAQKIGVARLAKRAEDDAVARNNLSRLLSPNLVEEVVKGAIAMEKGGEHRQATVFFSDIRGFTGMSERLGPQDMVSMLNEYFEIMVDIVFQHEGTLDKFVGDEIMAVWGAPVGQVDHAERALRTALDMMAALARFNRFRVANHAVPIHIGIGINTGDLVAGYMGSTRTLSYTVIGDTVNTASRLCGHAQAGEILVTDAMMEALGPRLVVERRPPALLKGKAKPVAIYRVLELKD